MLVNQEMYEGSVTFDPTMQGTFIEEHFSHTPFPNYPHNPTSFSLEDTTMAAASAASMEMDQQQPGWDLDYNAHCHQQHHLVDIENKGFINTNSSTLPNMVYPPTQGLLNLFHLQNSSNPAQELSSNHVMFDPSLPSNLPPQPPFFGELFQSLPHGYNLNGSKIGSIFSRVDVEGEMSGDQLDHEGDGILEFGREINGTGQGRELKGVKHYTTERHRRVHMNGKFTDLKKLLPISTKGDRASIVGDAINYINELKRTHEELKNLVERKRCSRVRNKRQKTTEESSTVVDGEDTMRNQPGGGESDGQVYNGSTSLRSSWLQRKSKNTEVDVRIVDDEVTIKLVQQKRINCLLFVSKVLDELQLDLHHVSGGVIGDFYSFLFNSKIYEGSSVYASAIANKLIEVVDRQYAAIPTSGY